MPAAGPDDDEALDPDDSEPWWAAAWFRPGGMGDTEQAFWNPQRPGARARGTPGSRVARPLSAMFVSPAGAERYIDPDTGILRNKMDARTQADYDRLKAEKVGERALRILAGIVSSPRWEPTGRYSFFERMRQHHEYLYQDVFPFAGEFRQAEMRLPYEAGPGAHGPGGGDVRYMSCAVLDDFKNGVDEKVRTNDWLRSYKDDLDGLRARRIRASDLQADTGRCRPFVDGNEDAFWMTIYELYRDARAGLDTRKVSTENHELAWFEALPDGSPAAGLMQENFEEMDLGWRREPDFTSEKEFMVEARRLNVGTVPKDAPEWLTKWLENWRENGQPGPVPGRGEPVQLPDRSSGPAVGGPEADSGQPGGQAPVGPPSTGARSSGGLARGRPGRKRAGRAGRDTAGPAGKGRAGPPGRGG